MTRIYFLFLFCFASLSVVAQTTNLSGTYNYQGTVNVNGYLNSTGSFTATGPSSFEGTVKIGGYSGNNYFRVLPKTDKANAIADFYDNANASISSYFLMGIGNTSWGGPLPGTFIWSSSNGGAAVKDFFIWMGPKPDVTKPAMYVQASTNAVAINTTRIPLGYMFAVNGGIVADKLLLKNISQWPDFVFEKEYKLPTLQEVKEFIQVNKHLPGVPSAASLNDTGLDVTQMNAILLQKLEEQTLYIIKLNEKIIELEAKIEKNNLSYKSL
ncbi:hypothetical protein [Chitinophaga flava]|uniref:Peptidase S74 domain-containing protein n=1 Tax=Chitinophaga flava TaxID=2259036 RepID=A0A365XUZ5_9BACT|nr:hypothetical protein [Chitinophaga flava]RBL89841.1 hypothetical protein DF182_25500 [Chitinophaga flava]